MNFRRKIDCVESICLYWALLLEDQLEDRSHPSWVLMSAADPMGMYPPVYKTFQMAR